MKNKVSSLIAEGILFCGSGILLLSYSLISYAKAFNKAWSQSPYLFPALVGAALIGLSIWIMGQGVLAMKRTAGESVLAKEADAKSADHKKKIVRILGVLVLCAIYYVVLGEVSIPRVTIGILSFSITISIFELATIIFLIAMMWFMKVRKVVVLVLVPIGTSLFLSIAFRTCLHVMLP